MDDNVRITSRSISPGSLFSSHCPGLPVPALGKHTDPDPIDGLGYVTRNATAQIKRRFGLRFLGGDFSSDRGD
jgi:hypothetical protein